MHPVGEAWAALAAPSPELSPCGLFGVWDYNKTNFPGGNKLTVSLFPPGNIFYFDMYPG